MAKLEITTIEQLEDEVSKVFLIVDRGVIRVLVAAVIANKLKLDAVWLMLVAPSSGGKSELISALNGLKFIHPISDVTMNTFASGFKGKPGEETSLLWKANYGIFTFKDFTSILSKNKEAKKEIMGQLREIYDGSYDKKTGNGRDIAWKGKIGAIAGATEMIYESMQDMSAMGDRFIMYSIEQPDRREVSRRVLANTTDMGEKRQHIQDCFTSYITYILEHVDATAPQLSEKTREELLDVADFATAARSAVMTNFKTGAVDFVPTKEMPMRVTSQLYNIAAAFLVMNKARPDYKMRKKEDDDNLSSDYTEILYKVAMDSIPVKRRKALQALATYQSGVSSGGLAALLNYPTETVKQWLYALNGLGIATRVKGRKNDEWVLKDEYRKTMIRFDKIQIVPGFLDAESEQEEIAWDSPDALEALDERNREEALKTAQITDDL